MYNKAQRGNPSEPLVSKTKGAEILVARRGFIYLKKMCEKTQTYSFSQTKNNRMLLANEINIVKLSWNDLYLDDRYGF